MHPLIISTDIHRISLIGLLSLLLHIQITHHENLVAACVFEVEI